ncbi:MAG: putA [Acidimicrobiaceae bacterium]|nr:putA [Acidimicrobiaceae bacterium]
MSQAPPDAGYPSDSPSIAMAEELARGLMATAETTESKAAGRRRRQIGVLLADPASQAFLTELTDQVLRISSPRRAALRLRDLVEEHGVPSFARGIDRAALLLGARFASVVPDVVIALATARLRRELAGLVLPAEPKRLARHIRERSSQGVRVNVNLLGEAVLGEQEAEARTERVIELIERPEVDYVSVKITSICSRLDVLAYEHSLQRIIERLRTIYASAARYDPPKFVNLDMEEYRDLQLTVDAFTTLLSEPDLTGLDAGIVLQAYLPDSYPALARLCTYARERHARHGSAIKVRIVKGANLAMERVEAELQGWQQAPFQHKEDVDANYKRLLDLALDPANAGALRVGVASHNLFDVGWALVRREAAGRRDAVEVEMLEGMAEPLALATSRLAGGLLLYAPVVRRDEFESAVAYLVRRFDENTAPENFLAHLFDLHPGTPTWTRERARFEAAVAARRLPIGPPRRSQDRAAEELPAGDETGKQAALGRPRATGASGRARSAHGSEAGAFRNEPDTDFTLERNRRWLANHLLSWKPPGEPVPAVVDGESVKEPASGTGIDPSAPASPLYRYVQADLATVERAVASAKRAGAVWRSRTASERREVLYRAAASIVSDRGRAIAVMAHDAGKTVGEADPEVSEAIDFARYYGDRALELDTRLPKYRFDPYDVVVLAPPWNFPFAIPAGGVFAVLAAGGAVILKPAPESVLTAWTLACSCWSAGVPRDLLQFVPTADDEVGRRLIAHDDVDAVILTGAFETGRRFLEWKPTLKLHAETSGKNAMVITAAADQDDAIRDLLRSAFSHAGQKCSAASLAIVESSLYDDPHFRTRLADAVRSLRVGPAWEMASEVGPLIRPPEGPLARALTELSPGEKWLVRPTQVGENPHLWSPGVKLGIAPGSEFHLTECFGPALGLMRAENLDEAIHLQNMPAYGLTGGIQTLDHREADYWLERVEVGNAYVNRHTTGAIVRRQPFGGWKRSSIGSGAKTGGPHYVGSLGAWTTMEPAVAADELDLAIRDWRHRVEGEDPTALCAESNIFRLRPLQRVALRLGSPPDPVALAVALGIALELRTALLLSADELYPGLPESTVVEAGAAFIARAKELGADRVRLHGVSPLLRLEVLDAGLDADVEPLSAVGSVELLHWTREQAESRTLHRHGNITPRASTVVKE